MSEDERNKIYAPHKLAEKAKDKLRALCRELLEQGLIRKWELGSMLQSLAYEHRVGTVYTKEFEHLNMDPNIGGGEKP